MVAKTPFRIDTLKLAAWDANPRTQAGMATLSSWMSAGWRICRQLIQRLLLTSLSCHDPSTSLETTLNTR